MARLRLAGKPGFRSARLSSNVRRTQKPSPHLRDAFRCSAPALSLLAPSLHQETYAALTSLGVSSVVSQVQHGPEPQVQLCRHLLEAGFRPNGSAGVGVCPSHGKAGRAWPPTLHRSHSSQRLQALRLTPSCSSCLSWQLLWFSWRSATQRESLRVGAWATAMAAPNTSLEPRPNGGPPGPGWRYAVHFRQPGPGVPPSAPSQLER